MSESWKAFFYGAFDPRATITIDKLAGSFLPQALSARIFGFHPWSLALPQVIEGVVSVLVMYRVVRRWAGPVPGLLAAGLLAVTPIAASMAFGVAFPGSVASFGGGRGGGAPAAEVAQGPGGGTQRYNAGGFLGSSGGWAKLAGGRFGPEIGWLYPLALLTLIAGLAWRGRAR